MNITFEDNKISSDIKKTVESIISRGGNKSGKILVEELLDEDLDCYEDEEHFIESHRDCCDIYMVYQDLGNWNQPLTMVAVAE